MAKESTTFTQRLIMILVSEIADRRGRIPRNVRVAVEALAKEHNLANYAERVLA